MKYEESKVTPSKLRNRENRTEPSHRVSMLRMHLAYAAKALVADNEEVL